MKIHELIEELRRFSQNMEVKLVDEDAVIHDFTFDPLVLDGDGTEAEDGANSPKTGYLGIYSTGAPL